MDISAGSVFKDKKTWRYKFYYRGKAYRAGGFRTKSEAAKAMQNKREEVLTHGGEIRNIEFMAAYEEYLCDMEGENSPGSVANKIAYGKRFSKFFEGHVLHSITESDIQKFKTKRKLERTHSTGTIDHEIGTLKHFFGWAIRLGYVDHNTAKNVKKFNDDFRRGVSLTYEEARRLLDASGLELKARILLALGYGLRHGEIASLKLEDIDRNNGTITFYRLKKRRQETATLQAPPELIEMLLSLPPGQGKRFGHVFRYRDCDKTFKRALINAGIDINTRFHDLRHTAASWQLENGQSLEAIRVFLGHADISTTARYLHVEDQRVHQMSAKTLKSLL